VGRDSPARQVVAGVRFGVLFLSAVLAALVGQIRSVALPLVLLIILAIVATLPLGSEAGRKLSPLVEAALAVAIIVTPNTLPEPLLPYLVVPPLAAGVESGFAFAACVSAVSAVGLAIPEWLLYGFSEPREYRSAAQWFGLGLATGAVGAWARREMRVAEVAAGSTYDAAHKLLSELREVTLTLPTCLDEVTLGQTLLGEVQARSPYDRAGLFTLGDLGQLLPTTLLGAYRLDWELDTPGSLWIQVRDHGTYACQAGSFSTPSTGSSAVLPLRLGGEIIGAVAIERDGPAWNRESLQWSQDAMDNAALQIDTGRLFSEIRAVATTQERHRLAREIHDGIAQEIASLGYAVDGIVANENDPAQRARITTLRSELSRIVSELRYSIFDLRSDMQAHSGLGAALSNYARQVGTSSGLTIHLLLDESNQRLGIETESELLRIAQEAVTNARRHSQAKNLWVTYRVSPPNALLRISDDGTGLGSPRIDSFGLDIMRERARRLGVELNIRERLGGGTVVEIALGSKSFASQSDD
jgi:signal transduction histidine kinase